MFRVINNSLYTGSRMGFPKTAFTICLILLWTGLPTSKCGTTPAPSDIGLPNCDFDGSTMCKWQPTGIDNFTFTYVQKTATTPGDHTSGYGTFLLVSIPANSTVSMSSPLNLTSGDNCLSLWYNMQGPGNSDLGVFIITETSNMTVWFKNSLTNIGVWQSMRAIVPGSETYKILKLTVTSGTESNGNVAIDDIKLDQGDCLRSAIIDFEGNSAGFTPDENSNFNWTVTPASQSFLADHTESSLMGHCLMASFTNQASGAKARFQSPIYPPASDECMVFWFARENNGPNKLEVLLMSLDTPSSNNNGKVLWVPKAADYITGWSRATVDISSVTPFRVVFQATAAGNNIQDAVAIDDISFSTVPCPRAGSCDFEYDECNYGLDIYQDSDIHWYIVTGQEFMPFDHTTQTSAGSYLAVNFPQVPSSSLSAKVESSELEPTQATCFSFWYYGSGVGTLSVWISGEETIYPEIHTSVSTQNIEALETRRWKMIYSDISRLLPYYITFGAEADVSNTVFVIDDILLTDGSCADFLSNTDNQQPTKPQLDPTKIVIGCDFEDKTMCTFTNNKDDIFAWLVFSFQSEHSMNTGLYFDITRNSIYGHHVYMDAEDRAENQTARLYSQTFSRDEKLCLSFYYGMYGDDVNRLNVYIAQPGQTEKLIWTRSHDQGQRWFHQMIGIDGNSQEMQLIFEGLAGSSRQSDIDLDDIWVFNQTCPSPGYCDFENSNLCNINGDIMSPADWILQKAGSMTGTGPKTDHTYQTGEGHYLYMDAIKAGNGTARIATDFYSYNSANCLSFWYHMTNLPGSSTYHMLSVHIINDKGIEIDLYHDITGVFPDKWNPTYVPLHLQSQFLNFEKFQIILKATPANAYGDISIDDLQVSSDSCFDTFDCDFTTDSMCDWELSETENFPAWMVNTDGRYIGVDFSNRRKAGIEVTKFKSQPLSGEYDFFCLGFNYMIFGDNIGYLNVSLESEDTRVVNYVGFSIRGDQGDQNWHKGNFTPAATTNYTLRFVITAASAGHANSSTGGEVRISNIKFFGGDCDGGEDYWPNFYHCLDNKTIVHPDKICNFINDCPAGDDESQCGTTNFETGGDYWTYDSDGQMIFVRVNNQSSQDANVNHNITGLGYYYTLQHATLLLEDYANLLLGKELGPSSPNCMMTFSYYVNVTEPSYGDLTLALEENDEATIIWHNLPVTSDNWQVAHVAIGGVHSRFQVRFKVNQMVYPDYAIGIDDISFENCSFPDSTNNACASGWFKCARGGCIEKPRTCDLVDDCGDFSDENSTLCGNRIMDNFEYSLGHWVHAKNRTFNWVRHSGQGSGLGNGPRRDHTLGTHKGHYLLFEPKSQKPGAIARIRSPSFKKVKDGCEMRLYYHMYGRFSSVVTVSMLTLRGGGLTLLTTLTPSTSDNWSYRSVKLESNVKFRVVLEGIVIGLQSSNIGIDDISFSKGCPRPRSQGLKKSVKPPKPHVCLAGQFRCLEDFSVCVNQSQVCDFTIDCPQGSDEQECGTCTFEEGLCGWRDESSGYNMWGRVSLTPIPKKLKHATDLDMSGNYVTPGALAPSIDVTYYAAHRGHFLSVEAGLGDTSLPAVLAGPAIQATGIECVFSFYLYKTGTTSATLEYGKRNATDPFRTVLDYKTQVISKQQNTLTWEMYSFYIGSGPAGIQPYIKVQVNPASDAYSFNIDQISLHNCLPEQQSVSKPYRINCTFDTDLCGLFNDYEGSLYWVRTPLPNDGLDGDHTTGRGYYISISFPQGSSGGFARLKSENLDPEEMKEGCLMFYYNMFGRGVESLKVFLSEGNNTILIFTRTYSQGNVWWPGQAKIIPTSNYQVIFEGTSNEPNGHISLDDIMLVPYPCPITSSCDFEVDLCGYTQPTNAQYYWTRVIANDFKTPSVDHTTEKETGHFLGLQINNTTAKNVAILMSPEYSIIGTNCLNFYYYIESNNTHKFEVSYQENGHTSSDGKVIWKRTGFGNNWFLAQETFNASYSFNLYFTVTFMVSRAVVNISLDDISIRHGACPQLGSCDFERDKCGYYLSNTIDAYFPWRRTNGAGLSDLTGPPVDHTTKSDEGFYMLLDSYNVPGNYSALMSSPILPGIGDMCLSFWYYAYAQNPLLEVYTTSVIDQQDKAYLLSVFRDQGPIWRFFIVNLTIPDPFQIHFDGNVVSELLSDMAVDDIVMSVGNCNKRSSSTVVKPIVFPPTPLDCNFDNRTLCQWKQNMGSPFTWSLVNKSVDLLALTPYDHSKENYEGWFVTAMGEKVKKGQNVQLLSPPLVNVKDGTCLKFWYFMYGFSVGNLSIKLQKDNITNDTPLWQRVGEQSANWIMGKVFVSSDDILSGFPSIVQFVIENRASVDGDFGDVRIDDISSNNGPCPVDTNNCGFESPDICGYMQDTTDTFDWSVRTGETVYSPSGPTTDNTYGTKQGHFMNIEAELAHAGSVARLLSSMNGPATGQCLRFFYQIHGTGPGSLGVKLMSEEGDVHEVWRMTGETGSIWRRGQAEINSVVSFQIAFEAFVSTSQSNHIAIDDVSLLDQLCPAPATCDFEKDLCLFTNLKQGDDFDWIRHKGSIPSLRTAPSIDHTTGSQSGYYLFIGPSASQKLDDISWLISNVLPSETGTGCLSFFYNLYGDKAGALSVLLDDIGISTVRTLVSISGLTGTGWTEKFVNVSTNQNFALIFEGKITSNSTSIAIDDISYTTGLCNATVEADNFKCSLDGTIISLNKKCDYVSDCTDGSDELNCGDCTFEEGLCGYTQISKGSYRWILASNKTMKTSNVVEGLGYDHTKGTEEGNMLYVDVNWGDENSMAVIKSPLLQRSYQTCTIQFYYKFSDWKSGEISVSLEFASSNMIVDIFSANQVYNPGSWHLAEAEIGYVAEPFSLYIRATRSDMSLGTVALDDVMLADCGPPQPNLHSSCSSSEFTCHSGFCVDLANVCDLAQDCGDGTDESNCKYTDACDFETSMCIWNQEKQTEAVWKRSSIEDDGSPYYRDHTTGLPTGHFVYLSSTPYKEGYRARLFSQTIQATSSQQCKLTLYYRMYNLSPGTVLNVYISQWDGGYMNNIFSRQNSNQDYWARVTLPLVYSSNFQIVIEGIQGLASNSSVAIDDVVLSPGCVLSETTLPTAGYTVTTTGVTVNSCSGGNFHQCANLECIPVSYVCDFISDCTDGSDEAICGPCEFEQDRCGWYEAGVGKLAWDLSTTDLIGTVGPAVDFTYKNKSGHYMYIKPAFGLTNTPARLVSSSLPKISSTCVISFHYYINQVIKGSINAFTQNQDVKSVIMPVISPSVSSGWGSLTYIMQNASKSLDDGWQFVIEFYTNASGIKSIAAVDSIQFENCSLRQEVVNLRCSFDDDSLCDWKQGNKDVFDWQLRKGGDFTSNGPLGDHSASGLGYYLLAVSKGQRRSDTASLESPLMPPTVKPGRCFSFWYFMEGTGVGTLRVQIEKGTKTSQRFIRQRSMLNHWQQGLVTIKSSYSFTVQVIAEVTGETLGDFAVDDFQFTDGSCEPPDECTFEDGNLCKWQQTSSDNFNWIIGSNISSHDSVPATDHTMGTDDGYFVYVPTDVKGTAVLSLPVSSDMSSLGCLQFWYHMAGSQKSEINVQQMYADGHSVSDFSIEGPSEDAWRRVFVNIDTKHGNFNLKIIGTTNGGSGHIAIDDTLFTNDTCPPPGECDFNENFCGFINMAQAAWVLQNANQTVASRDSFAVVEGTTLSSDGEMAVLLSEVIVVNPNEVPDERCLRFKASLVPTISGLGSKTVNVYRGNVANKDLLLLGTEDAITQNEWVTFQVAFPVNESFEFSFVALLDSSLNFSIAIDDVSFLNGDCSGSRQTTATTASTSNVCTGAKFKCHSDGLCLDPNKHCDFNLNCTDGSDEQGCYTLETCKFDNDTCGWTEPNGHFWVRGSPSNNANSLLPSFDADLNTGSSGHFMYLNYLATNGVAKNTSLQSRNFEQAATTCQIQISYYVSRPDFPLKMYINYEDNRDFMWQSYVTADKWQTAVIEIGRRRDLFFIEITTNIGSSYNGITALDNIKFLDCEFPGVGKPCTHFVCPNKACVFDYYVCDGADDCGDFGDESLDRCKSYSLQAFSSGFGGLTQGITGVDDTLDWKLWQPGDLIPMGLQGFDHTDFSSKGGYLYAVGEKAGDTAWLISMVFDAIPSDGSCLGTYYRMIQGVNTTLTIHMRTNSSGTPYTWVFGGSDGRGTVWLQDLFYMKSATPFQLIFIASFAEAGEVVAMDDLSFNSSCRPYNGDFPTKFCLTGEFQCSDNTCVELNKVCDEKKDCKDGSDELHCSSTGQPVTHTSGTTSHGNKNPVSEEDSGTDSWKAPVGGVLGTVAVAAVVVGVVFYLRKTNRICSSHTRFTSEDIDTEETSSTAETDIGAASDMSSRTNPLYDMGEDPIPLTQLNMDEVADTSSDI